MKLKQIADVAQKQVPVWQPVLLGLLLLLGFTVVPLIAKTAPTDAKKELVTGSTLGIQTVKDTLSENATNLAKPYVDNLQKQAESVLGVAQQTATSIVVTSSQQAKDYVIDSTLGKLLDSVHSLPKEEQDILKKAICK